MDPANKPLSHVESKFVDFYHVEPNATKAYKLATGRDLVSAGQRGHEMLQRPHVQAELARRRKEASEAAQADAESILRELRKVAFVNIGDFIQVDKDGNVKTTLKGKTPEQLAGLLDVDMRVLMTEDSEDGTKSMKLVSMRFRTHDKLRALQLLGEHAGLFGRNSGKGTGLDESSAFVEGAIHATKTILERIARRASDAGNAVPVQDRPLLPAGVRSQPE